MNAPAPDPGTRVEELIAAMTWAEKVAQLQVVFRPDPDDLAEVVRAGVGAVFWPRGAARTNAVQRLAVEETRLGVPLLVGLDVVHGQRTTAPVPLALASSFDPDLVEEVSRRSAREAASGGVNWAFAPVVDVSRDPRWGRCVEGFGESPHLTSAMGRAVVRGFQGDDLAAPDAVAACAKHFVAYGQPEGGRDYAAADVSEHRLRSVHLEPFRAVVAEGVASVMASFNTVAGRPAHAHRGVLTGVLKEEWGHDGVAVGDAEGVPNLLAHGVAATLREAGAAALGAGLDVEMGGSLGVGADACLLVPGDVPLDRVDDAVRRVLRLKQALGLFEAPYVDADVEVVEPDADARALARRAATRSTVLLRNDGTLPLARPRRVLLVGPYARSTDHLGAWVQSFAAPSGDLDTELRARLPQAEVTTEDAVTFLGPEEPDLDRVRDLARAHDVVVVAVGEPSDLTGEASSRSDLRLPGRQEDLVHAVADAGTPFVVVLVTGRPLVVRDWVDRAPAVLLAWHLGLEAPAALLDVLLGEADPAGRLPMSFPRDVGQVPVHHEQERTGRPASRGGRLVAGADAPAAHDVGLHGPANTDDRFTSKYLDLELGPQFAFGHGGGYARIEHSPPRVSRPVVDRADLAAGAVVELSVEAVNTSERTGDTVWQVYVEDLVATLAPPVRRLAAFARITLAPGERRTTTFAVGTDELACWAPDADGRLVRVVEPGAFRLHAGGTLDAALAVDLVVT